MEYEIYIKVDTNDADYIAEVSTISEEDLNILKNVMERVAKFEQYKSNGITHHHNFPTGALLRSDLGEKSIKELYNITAAEYDIISEYVPYGEWGCHTIEEVRYQPKGEWTVLL